MKLILLVFFFLNLIAINCAYWYGWLAGYPGIIKCRLKIWVLYFMKLKAVEGCTWKRKTTHQLPPVVSASVAEMGQCRLHPFCCAERFIWIARCVPKASQFGIYAVLQKALLSHHNLYLFQEEGEGRVCFKAAVCHSESPTFLPPKTDSTKHSKNLTLTDLWMIIPEPISYLELYEKYVAYCNRSLAMLHIWLVWLYCTTLQSRGCALVLLGLFSLLIQHAVHWTTVTSPTQRILPLNQQNERQ